DEAGDIGRAARDRIVDRARHAAERGLVQHDVHAVAGAPARVERADVALDEADAGGQVLALAGGEVVEADYRLAELQELLGEVRADEARRSGHQPGPAAALNALLRGFVAVHFCSWLPRAPRGGSRSARPSRARRSGSRPSRA